MPLDVEGWSGHAVACVLVPFRPYAGYPGQYTGTYTDLDGAGALRADGSPAQDGDWLRLTQADNDFDPVAQPGIYVRDTTYQFDQALPTKPTLLHGEVLLTSNSEEYLRDGQGGYFVAPDDLLIQHFGAGDIEELEVIDTATGGGLYWVVRTKRLRATFKGGAGPALAIEPEGMIYQVTLVFEVEGFEQKHVSTFVIDADADYDSVLIDGCIPVDLINASGLPVAAQDLFDARLQDSSYISGIFSWTGSEWEPTEGARIFVRFPGDPAPPASVRGDIVIEQI